MEQSIRWIFFDLGSTLIDETAADLCRIREMTAGTAISAEQYRQKRLELIRQGFSGDPAAISFFGLTKTPWHSELEQPFPDTAPTLSELKRRGFRLGVIANQNPGTAGRLARWELLQYFDVVVASAEAGAAKPDPAIFRMALDQAGCTPDRAVMVGDRLDNDVAPAGRLGMHTVRILRGLGRYHKPRSEEEEPEHTVRELAELSALFTAEEPEMVFLDTSDLKTETISLRLDHTFPGDPVRQWVPAYYFDILDGAGKKAGSCDLRIGHTEGLYYGGNIGYIVDEPFRGHHYAEQACRLLFGLARRHGMSWLIITCQPTNLPSRRTCERLGGVLLEIAELPPDSDLRLQDGHTHECIYRFDL